MSINNGDMPINPHEHVYAGGTLITIGLTKREHFAALAMQCIKGMESNPSLPINEAARISVLLADALLKELEK